MLSRHDIVPLFDFESLIYVFSREFRSFLAKILDLKSRIRRKERMADFRVKKYYFMKVSVGANQSDFQTLPTGLHVFIKLEF